MGFIENLGWRYATKKFDGRKVPANDLKKIVKAIQLAPSSFGLQPYYISVIENDRLKKASKPHTWNQEQIATCSHIFVFSADLDINKKIDKYLELACKAKRVDITDDREFNYGKEAKKFVKQMGPEWSAKQVYIALGFALAACAELMIDSCPMEAFDPETFKKNLSLPINLEPKVLLAVGYRSSKDTHARLPKIRFEKQDLFDFRK